VIIYMAVFLSVLIGCCGLMLDVGLMEILNQQVQNGADAAALGGAYSLQNSRPMLSGALADAQTNGFVSGVNNTTVTIANPPASGAYAGNSLAVQATVTRRYIPTFFPGSFNISAQATALVPQPPCVYLLSQYTTAKPSLNAINETISGNCPFYIGYSYFFNGGSSSSGNQFLLHGSSARSSGTVTPSVIHAPAMGDPLGYVPQPLFGMCQYNNMSVTAAATLLPGTYCGGLTVNTSAKVTFSPGMYVIAGNLNINGPTLIGAGITFFMTQGGGSGFGTASITNVNTTLSAPTSGAWQGILFFSDRSMPTGQAELSLANWNPSSKVDGILYLVGQELLASNIPLQGYKYLGLVADFMDIHNTGFITSADYSGLSGGNPFQTIGAGLVE
jgi:Putative Flp pilus-assembly TadE/G-like